MSAIRWANTILEFSSIIESVRGLPIRYPWDYFEKNVITIMQKQNKKHTNMVSECTLRFIRGSTLAATPASS